MEQWAENAYYQYFSGTIYFKPASPCEASELVHFRNQIWEQDNSADLQESIRLNGKGGKHHSGSIDTTLHEKKITYSTEAKLHRKIIRICTAILKMEKIQFPQSYTRTLKEWV